MGEKKQIWWSGLRRKKLDSEDWHMQRPIINVLRYRWLAYIIVYWLYNWLVLPSIPKGDIVGMIGITDADELMTVLVEGWWWHD